MKNESQLSKKVLSVSFLLSICIAPEIYASNFGLSIAYNNPAGADIGANLEYFGSQFAFEVGIGSVGFFGNQSTKGAGLSGDMNVKMMFLSKWRPYIEAGLATEITGSLGKGGGLSFGAGGPFAGAGLLFDGSPVFVYAAADYKFVSQKIYPVFGVGVKF